MEIKNFELAPTLVSTLPRLPFALLYTILEEKKALFNTSMQRQRHAYWSTRRKGITLLTTLLGADSVLRLRCTFDLALTSGHQVVCLEQTLALILAECVVDVLGLRLLLRLALRVLVIGDVVQAVHALRLLVLVLVPVPLLLGRGAGWCAGDVILSLFPLGVDIVGVLLCLLFDLIVGLLGLLLDPVLGLAGFVDDVLSDILCLFCCGLDILIDLLEGLADLAVDILNKVLIRGAQT